jgi:ABC-type multidrug transport system ATPase subunit/pSer/pThr/pTyr-binding forkhead associated (FHA) protein/ABC-type multidrug transport system permease subunit
MNQPNPQSQSLPTQRASLDAPTLEVKTNNAPDVKLYQLTKPATSVGKDATNDIVIDEPTVSRQHLLIYANGMDYTLVHPHPSRSETTNGLFYQGTHIPGNQRFQHQLKHSDIFRIQNKDGTFVTLTFRNREPGSTESLPQVSPILLRGQPLTIGRDVSSNLVLDHPQVSRYHARLAVSGNTYVIYDMGSTNHTYVNGQRVSSRPLQPQDEIRIGPFRFIYQGNALVQYDESRGIRLEALQLSKQGDGGVTLLHDISLVIPPRKFVAVVGGSGAGKSTLLDALNGLRPATKGAVFYNGQDYYRNFSAFSTQLGYVPQDDIVHRDLTVERALYYAARLRLPADFTDEQISRRIAEVVQSVELTKQISLPISKLSGGQRKRVSIALELLAKPSIFFLDEPTSGLDPGLDRKMMALLRNLADNGQTIILVTHATNNINICDYICFLAKGGRLVYFGPPQDAKRFFNKKDFAEIYTSLDDDAAAEEAEMRFRHAPEYQQYVQTQFHSFLRGAAQQPTTQLIADRRGSFWQQFLLLSQRYLELLKNDRKNLAILLLQAPLMAVLLYFMLRFGIPSGTQSFDPQHVVRCPMTSQVITSVGLPDVPTPSSPAVSTDCNTLKHFLETDPRGQAYAQKRGGVQQAMQDFIVPGPGSPSMVLFLMAFSAVMFGCINSTREIVKESAIYRRERTVNIGILPYLGSKIVILGALCLAQSFVLVLGVQIIDPFHAGIIFPSGFFEIYITIALTALAGTMMGLVVSALVANTDRATSFIPILLLPQVVFSGILFPLTNAGLQLVGWLWIIRWSIAALVSSVGVHSDKTGGDKLIGNDYTSHGIIFSTYSQASAAGHLWLMWLALLLMIIGFASLTALFLKLKDRRQ